MSDGRDYRDVLDNIIRGAKVGGAVVAEGILAASGAHPGLTGADSDWSLISKARGKSNKGEGLGKAATGADARDQVIADMRDKEGRPEGSRSMREILSDTGGKTSKKGGKGKLAKAALSALGGGAIAPFEPSQYMPTSVAMSVAPYTGGRPTKTKEEYAKDIA